MNEKIIFFDGVCNLCNGSVRFVIKRDREAQFKFASLQSDFAADFFREKKFNTSNLDSIILYDNGVFYSRSTAALRIARKLSGLWFLFYAFIIIPPFIRDTVYDFIARKRYEWFGKKDYCEMPEPGMKARFLG